MNIIDIKQATARIPSAKRILVFGCSGSGKSTLSKKLADRFGLRHISMDKEVFWLPGWQARSRDEMARRVEQLVEEERWIMDGTSPRTMPFRLPKADFAIWMRPPRWRSLLGVYQRVFRTHGRVRPEMAKGCPEQLPDLEFLRYIWNFEKIDVPEIEEMFGLHGAHVPVLVLKSRGEIEQLLALTGVSH
jgi:adenylate kinase family enzyme